MAPRHLDEIDEQLLAELVKNARVSLVTLGERVHLSRNAVRQRVERMERDGIIGGYTVTRGKRSSGPHPIRANVFIYRTDRMRGDRVLAAVSAMPEVVRCDILSGDFDLLVTIEAESAERMQSIWEQIAALPEVKNTITSLTLATVFQR
ncbi:MAG TPA: Lrp/AsnC family transcriptional regulator [Humibacter sp.]|jgi:DNA-binding Lrp family transcriptional regulator|nr:Lrp/AsnC family transcriptional regulator [Humibacter sp.]